MSEKKSKENLEKEPIRREAIKKPKTADNQKTAAKKTSDYTTKNKNTSESTRKHSRKLTRAGRNALRKSVAGVLLASSLVVAAIPTDHSGSAIATSLTDSYLNEKLDYEGDKAETRNGNLKDTNDKDISFLEKASITDEYMSYEISQVGGTWRLDWKYQYYVPDKIFGISNNDAIISNYNSTFNVETLRLTSKIINAYEWVTESEYNSYITTNRDLEFKLKEPTRDNGSTKVSEVEKYFPDELALYKSDWNTAVARYQQDEANAEHKNDYTADDLTRYGLSFFSKKLSDMTTEMQKIYYCDHNKRSDNATYMNGYTLVSITNSAAGSSYFDDRDPDNPKSIPADLNIYVARSIDNKEHEGTDSNGYLISGSRFVKGIGESAFADARNVNNLVAGENVAFIGDSAFKNSFIQSVEFASLQYVGNYVFQECKQLRSINLSDHVVVIGKEAFQGCKQLDAVKIPKNTEQIGFGAFANCESLKNVDFSENLGCNVGEYAFYGDINLESVKFPSTPSFGFGKACFALDSGTGSSSKLKSFAFPKNAKQYKSAVTGAPLTLHSIPNSDPAAAAFDIPDTYTAFMGDYMFANRNNLEEVTFPDNYGSGPTAVDYIPMNTFDACPGLAVIYFNGGNRNLQFDSNLFEDVENAEFYVRGPEASQSSAGNNSYAFTRTSTWACKTAVSDYVPYVYERGGEDHYEVGIGPADSGYRYELKINKDGTADLQSCIPMNAANTEAFLADNPFVVPGEVAGYKVKSMQEGCLDALVPLITTLIIDDNSVENIADNNFAGCPKLQTVILRNSVKTIGENAFANNTKLENVFIGENIERIGTKAFYNCPKLENVYFKEPESITKLGTLGADAFKTDSNKLTFHGTMQEGYIPFDYAMNANNSINDSSINIAYQTLAPGNFEDGNDSHMTAIKDIQTGLVTLIDYPHYYDLPTTLRTKYENGDPLSSSEQALLDATLYIDVPKAVESIDILTYLTNAEGGNNKNEKNFVYFSTAPAGVNSYTEKELYSSNVPGSPYEDYTPGLFSAAFSETTELEAYGAGPETGFKSVKGNDWILSVNIPGVQEIPDNCFDSCERLKKVTFSDACDKIGESCFKDCTRLTELDPTDSTKFDFDNYILYQELDDGSLEINTCLPSRGENHSVTEIWVDGDHDPLLDRVSSIKDAAFKNCAYITEADLSTTEVSQLPIECFKGCKALNSVILPDTIRSIRRNAFENGSSILDVVIPTDTQISDEAFDKSSTVTIETYPDCGITANYSATNGATIYVRYLNSDHTITFLNDDLTIFEQIVVTNGANGFEPETNPTPKLSSHTGYKFAGWHYDHPDGFKKVTENRQAIAEFTTTGTPGGGGTGGGTGGGGAVGTFEVSVVSGTGSGFYKPGDTVNIAALASPTPGQEFDRWTTSNTDIGFNDPTATATAFIMPSHDVSIAATYKTAGTSGSSASGNGVLYNVVVENGSGSGQYEAGRVVMITAYAPSQENRVFDRWTTSNTDIGFSDSYATSTTFVMPTHDVKVTATYKNYTGPKPGTTSGNNAGNGTNGNNGSNGNGQGSTSGNNAGNGGNSVVVTTDTIDNNHKNLASATVAGSTDNFVVKITDSAASYAAVEAALRAKYGNDLTNVKFVAFDISLYDETGTKKIENFDNLAVTITLPIPDEMVSYAGNNKAAAIINGAVDDKTVRFTTIDGVPCMTFTATHFSPYTIYVNTQTLLSGVHDETPKTGDGIAPKWFLAIGLALGSAVLFLYKEQRKIPGLKK